MNINNRLFSYPVLTSDGIGGDYKSAIFDVTSSYKMNMEGLSLSYHINLDCPELAKLVYDGMAEFVIHVECTETSYRRIYKKYVVIPSLQNIGAAAADDVICGKTNKGILLP